MKNAAFGLFIGFCIGLVIGGESNGWIRDRHWQKQLISMGCAGYDMHTGEWTLTGGTCNVQALEPEQ